VEILKSAAAPVPESAGTRSDALGAAATPGAVSGGRRLASVDGLRAVAAMWVVLFHIRVFSGAHLTMVRPLDFLIRSGSTGVSLFLVLSGFCLYLPFAAGRAARFSAGRFLIRRARRLLPAYYASLLLALVLNLAGAGRLGFAQLSPQAALGQIVTHLTLTHTLLPSTFYALNGAYWSLGLEWQLYLALPLLIISVRHFGLTRTVLGVSLVNVVYRLALAAAAGQHLIPPGTLLSVVLPNQLPGRWAEFAFGMVAAELYAKGTLDRCIPYLRFAWLPLVVAAVATRGDPLSHILFGAVFFLLLVAALGQIRFVSAILAWPPLVALGVMSYSVYLVHQPLIQAGAYVLRHWLHLSPLDTFAALLALLPVILGVAWVLFVTVERRTVTSHPSGLSRTGSRLLFPTWHTPKQRVTAAEAPAAATPHI